MGWRDIARSTDERTVIAGVVPLVGVGNKISLMFVSQEVLPLSFCLIANLTSIPFDYSGRQKVGGTIKNFFIFKQMPLLPPTTYHQNLFDLIDTALQSFIAPRVLELIYTAYDLVLWAQGHSYTGPPFRWDEDRRFLIRCELDALYFHLYDINREDADYILETSPIFKRKDEQRYGEYHTKRVIPECYDAMAQAQAQATGQPYQTFWTRPRLIHGWRIRTN